MFETYDQYVDSVFYDASAWSVANFYNIPYQELTGNISLGKEVTDIKGFVKSNEFRPSKYAYLIKWEDYNAHAALYYLQDHGVRTLSSFKPFEIQINNKLERFGYGTVLIPVSRQAISKDSLDRLVKSVSLECKIDIWPTNTGYSTSGIDLGSGNINPLKKPEVAMLVEGSVSSYEAGEVWHLLDTRLNMPITKVPIRNFKRLDLDNYNTLVLVSGRYEGLDSMDRMKISSWVKKGNTLITSRSASEWAIKQKLVKEKLVEDIEDKKNADEPTRKPYVDARENIGKNRVGGAIFEVELDISHPLAFGYTRKSLPVYRNSTVWLTPSKNSYATVAKYSKNPHIDGFITKKNLNEKLKGSASLLVSKLGSGRVVLFADNPNFRGSWYGTNKLFLNAIFLGQHVNVPNE